MHTLQIDLAPDADRRGYPILIGSGLLSDARTWADRLPKGPLLAVTNATVGPLYLPRLRAALGSRPLAECVLPDGEQFKTLDTLGTVFDALARARVNRDGAVLALGGGVVGDLAGYAAASWQRGVAYAQLPTTLLAQVDSSVGGKTAVNHASGKNLIGAFHQPVVVVADTDSLVTLPDRELRAGLAEVIKYGFIQDRAFLEWLESAMPRLLARDAEALTYAIRRSCEVKAEIVGRDEKEHGDRVLLNFGHTFGHAIETAAGYGEWLHGEAVSIGMAMAAETSERLGWLSHADVQRVRAVLASAGLPVDAPRIGVERALDLMRMDKKVLGGRVRLVLLRALGDAVVSGDYDEAALLGTLRAQVA
jgi:3-dehydroquinate synthase